MLKKLLFSTVLTMPLCAASFAAEENGTVNGIDDLRRLCENLERDDQVKLFNKGFLCTGTHTAWKERAEDLVLSNEGSIKAITSYEKSDNPLSTPGESTNFSTPNDAAKCRVYDKYKLQAPKVPIYLETCSDLTAANIQEKCQAAIEDYCTDNSAASDAGYDAKVYNDSCVSEKIASYNTCDLHKKN